MDEAPLSPEGPPPLKKVAKKSADKMPLHPDRAVNEVLRDALRQYLKDKNDAHKSDIEIDAMIATCQEFLQSFIIFGYDFNGDPINPVFFAHNQQEADALSMYLTKFFNAHIVNGGFTR